MWLVHVAYCGHTSDVASACGILLNTPVMWLVHVAYCGHTSDVASACGILWTHQ